MTTDYDDDDNSNNGDSYNRHRKRQGNKSREQSTEARDIGIIPKVVNPKRRAACARDLRKYLLTYYPESFPFHSRRITSGFCWRSKQKPWTVDSRLSRCRGGPARPPS